MATIDRKSKAVVSGKQSSRISSGGGSSMSNNALNAYKRNEQLLNFSSDELFGRDLELDLLSRVQRNLTNAQAENGRARIAWVHGESGAGKTSVCRAALFTQERRDVFVIEGKFEQFVESTSVPYSAIVDAFNKLGETSALADYKAEMKECLQYEGNILTKLIPSFSVYDTDLDENSTVSLDDDNGDAFTYATERLAIAFRSFLRSFTVKVRPLLIFLDDLQWADRYSKELITSILHDEELKNFAFVGAFRDENLDLIQPFLDSMHDLALDDAITDIALKDLELDAVNGFLSSVLSQSVVKTKPLAELIHRKTSGNPYFVIQLLKQLYAHQILSYNLASLKWEWDIEGAKAGTDLSDNVVGAIADRTQRVPGRVQRVLQLAACLGFVVDITILRQLDLGLDTDELSSVDSGQDSQVAGQLSGQEIVSSENYETQAFENALTRAEQEGFVEVTASRLKFSHDLIHQSFYDMVGEADSREKLHYEIGCYLKKNHNGSDRLLFLAVDQLNRASSLINTDDERLSLIQLNYDASQAAKHHAGVEVISHLLHKAIQLVQPSFWQFYYDLMLEVYNSSVEVDFSLGMLEEAKATIAEIMERAVREVDKVRAMVVEFQMYGVQCEFTKAISHGSRVLRLLGEPVPKKATLLNVVMEYFKARREAKNKPDEFFINRASTESSNVKIILRILQVGSVYGWNGDVNFAGFAMLRGFRISLREGSSDSTPFLYSGYGFMLGLFGQYDEAFRFGQLAQSTRKSKETFPSAISLHYLSLSHLQLPVGIGLEPYLSAYRLGLETGDLFFGSTCLSCYVVVYLQCGLPLRPFACDLRNFGEQLSICHQELQLAWLLSARQFALNLMGETDDPLDFSREAIISHHKDIYTENLLQGLEDESCRKVNADILFTWYLQLFAACILEDVETVEMTTKRLLKLKNISRRFGGSHAANYFLAFVDGLAGLLLSKMKPKSKTGPRVTKSAIAELREMSKTRPVNSITLLKLLVAEEGARKKSTSTAKARRNYNEAINELSRSGLNHFCAIANELAGKNMLERRDREFAEYYLENALRKWHEYDATVKVQQLVETYSFLEPIAEGLSRDAKQSFHIQGRARFNASTDALPTSGTDSERRLSGGLQAKRVRLEAR